MSHTDLPVRRPAKALAWGLAHARRELSRWPIPWPRRNRLLSACAVALQGALRNPPPGGWTVRRWGALVRRLLARLGEEVLGTGRDLYAQVRWLAGQIREDLARELRARAASAELSARLREERARARAAWRTLAMREGAGMLGVEVGYAAH